MCKNLIYLFYHNRFVRFCVVGTSGLIVNLMVFYLLNSVSGFGVSSSAIVSFFVASINNYLINTFWTFSASDAPLSRVNYTKYLVANLIGLVVNVSVLNLIIAVFGVSVAILAQFFAVLSATAFNFVLSRKFVFKG